jgi:hypothetical protein
MRSIGRLAVGSLSPLPAVSLLLFAGLGASLGPAYSQAPGATTGTTIDKGNKATDLRGEWQRIGPSFACKVNVREKLPPEQIKPEILARACLHMGPFVIGDAAQALRVLGAPHRTLPQPNGAAASIYFLETPEQYPYLIATVSKNRIVALQVTGPAAAKGYDFNHVDLGATTDTLVQYFGQPNHLEPSGEKDTELWAYRPWPFSFEVRGGHVTSIRINESK